MSMTMDRIQELSNERYQLWLKAARDGLSSKEQGRIREITRELETLWDAYRRELAAISRDGHQSEREALYSDVVSLKKAA